MLLNTLSISNFKCFDKFEIDFDEKKTKIAGDNGTGKTSICDAYFWLLFGKNSSGQALNPRPKCEEATKTTVTANLPSIAAKPSISAAVSRTRAKRRTIQRKRRRKRRT